MTKLIGQISTKIQESLGIHLLLLSSFYAPAQAQVKQLIGGSEAIPLRNRAYAVRAAINELLRRLLLAQGGGHPR